MELLKIINILKNNKSILNFLTIKFKSQNILNKDYYNEYEI